MSRVGFFSDLNPVQLDAVTFTEGPLLVVAGAGSGKTRVLTYRIAHLIENLGVHPSSILAITFTNKAADEMRERVFQLVGKRAENIWIMTFHAACARILRQEIAHLGYSKNFVVYDEKDSLKLIADCLKELNYDSANFKPSIIRNRISLAKNDMIEPNEFASISESKFDEVVASVYRLYQKKLKESNALDFDDLLLITVKLLKKFPEVLEKYQQRFRYILVDEYQDTNRTQYELLKLLAQKHRNICVVGDDDQSIYGWRGADVRNILDFEKDFPDATIIRLEQNYRSTKTILDAANHLISHNKKRKPKKLWTENDKGETITLYEAFDEYDEAQFIAAEVQRLTSLGSKYSYGDIAVFYRTNAQSRTVEEVFMKYGIPYVIVGGVKFYDRQEIKDVLAYLRLVVNPNDVVSFKRVINTPKRGIGKQTVEKLEYFAYQEGIGLLEATSRVDELKGRIGSKALESVKRFFQLIDFLREQAEQKTPAELVWMAAEKSGYIDMLKEEKTIEAEGRIENIQELVSVAVNFSKLYPGAGLPEFLERISLISDIDTYERQEEAVTLMTVHNAKGLEFPVVFIIGLEEGLFPHSRSMYSEDEIEEERRLCYVGITRAKEKLYLIHAYERTFFGTKNYSAPSRFLSEIPQELISIERVSHEVPWSHGQLLNFTFPREMDSFKPGRLTVEKIRVGDRVYHDKFGEGTVTDVGGGGRVTVVFDSYGEKVLVLDYAPMKKIS
jgi:DNA helicase-2/ATP-dependent DNA helicase PcrA